MSDTSDGQADTRKRSSRKRAVLRRRNLPLLMLVTRDGIAAYFRPIFKQHGLTEQQYRVVRALYEGGEASIGEVGAQCHILGPSLTGLLDRMRKAGFIVNRIDESDMRRSYVSLTRAGRTTFEAMVPAVEAAYARLEDEVGGEEVRALYEHCDRVLAALHAVAAPDEE